MDEQPSSLTGNADVTGSMGIASSVMSAGSTVRNVRPSTITKPRNRASVVGGDHKMTHKDLHSVFMPSSRDLAVTTDEQVARVQLIHEKFSEGAEFSFNYNTMLLVASILAGLGLASNSTATIIASMLVSPIMGPVVGMAYAFYIHDRQLFYVAFRTEMVSLAVCVIMGVLLSCTMGWTSLASDWPTPEMQSRGTWTNLLVGLPIAFFSGLGVAVSLLDDQMSSLVGVAISASLLPPAVNCGLLMMSFVFYEKNVLAGNPVVQLSGGYDVYEDVSDEELAWLQSQFLKSGGISLLLTIANVILIILSSIVMFRLKERLPVRKKVAWEDLGVARRIYTEKAVVIENTSDSDSKNKSPDARNSDPVTAVGYDGQVAAKEATAMSDDDH